MPLDQTPTAESWISVLNDTDMFIVVNGDSEWADYVVLYPLYKSRGYTFRPITVDQRTSYNRSMAAFNSKLNHKGSIQ